MCSDDSPHDERRACPLYSHYQITEIHMHKAHARRKLFFSLTWKNSYKSYKKKQVNQEISTFFFFVKAWKNWCVAILFSSLLTIDKKKCQNLEGSRINRAARSSARVYRFIREIEIERQRKRERERKGEYGGKEK